MALLKDQKRWFPGGLPGGGVAVAAHCPVCGISRGVPAEWRTCAAAVLVKMGTGAPWQEETVSLLCRH